MDRRIQRAIDEGARREFFVKGSKIVVITGWRAGTGFTNTMRIVDVPELKKTSSFSVLKQTNLEYDN